LRALYFWRAIDFVRRQGRLHLQISDPNHRCNESIAPPREGFDEAWPLGFVTQSLPELLYGCVEAMVEIDKVIARPDP
jgi:hypothetical protein